MKALMLLIILGLGVPKCIGQVFVDLDYVLKVGVENLIASEMLAVKQELGNAEIENFHKQFAHSVSLVVDFPNLNHSIDPVTLPDGSDRFVKRSMASTSVGLNYTKLLKNGMQVNLSTAIRRLDQFGIQRQHSYAMNWLSFSISQNISKYNPIKWEIRLIEERKIQQQVQYIREREKIRKAIVAAYFDTYIAQVRYNITKEELKNAMRIYENSKALFEFGKISEIELLKQEYNLVESQYACISDSIEYENKAVDLINRLNLPFKKNNIQLEEPPLIRIPTKLNDDVFQRASIYAFDLPKRIMYLNNEKDLTEINGLYSPKVKLGATIGLNDQGRAFEDLTSNPASRQIYGIQFNIPLINGGQKKAKLDLLSLNRKYAGLSMKQQELELRLSLDEILNRNYMINNRLPLVLKKIELSRRQVEIAFEKLMLGESIHEDYIRSTIYFKEVSLEKANLIRDLWINYYVIRETTLYDYSSNKPLML